MRGIKIDSPVKPVDKAALLELPHNAIIHCIFDAQTRPGPARQRLLDLNLHPLSGHHRHPVEKLQMGVIAAFKVGLVILPAVLGNDFFASSLRVLKNCVASIRAIRTFLTVSLRAVK